MPRGLLAQTEEQSVNGLPTPVRGAIDERNEVYQAAIKVEEGDDESDEDIEGSQPKRPRLLVHSFRIGIVMMLVVLTQSVGVSRVSFGTSAWIRVITDTGFSCSANGPGMEITSALSWSLSFLLCVCCHW